MKRRKSRITTRELALVSALVVIISVFGTAIAFTALYHREAAAVSMHLRVSNYTGFNLDSDALYFGTVPPGGSGARDLIIRNEADSARLVSVVLAGPLAEWVSAGESSLTLSGRENRTIPFQVIVPEGAEFGEYIGTISLIFTPAP
jgi:hypothetical protein